MADFSLTDFRAAFAEFAEAEFPDAAVNAAANFAGELAGNGSNMMLLYATAHVLALDSERQTTPDGGSGIVMSESSAGQSVSYENQEGDAFFKSTTYGRKYLALERRHSLTMVPQVYR